MTNPPVTDFRDLPYRTLYRIARIWGVPAQMVLRTARRHELGLRRATWAEVGVLLELGEIKAITRTGRPWVLDFKLCVELDAFQMGLIRRRNVPRRKLGKSRKRKLLQGLVRAKPARKHPYGEGEKVNS